MQKEGAKKAETAGFAKFTLQAPGQIYLSAEELNTIFGVQKEDAGVKLTFNKDVLGTTLTNPFLMLFTCIFHTSEDKTVPIFIPISTLLPSFL